MKRLLLVLLVGTSLSGCQTIGRWADNVGSYMPVIGDRCENWQCMTSDGQARSEAIRAERDNMESGEGEEAENEDGDEEGEDVENSTIPYEKKEPIIPPSTESGIPDVEQRGTRKPFPSQF